MGVPEEQRFTVSPAAEPFTPTRWTLVLRARGDSDTARQALGELCETYWSPVFRFLRVQGRSEDSARELTQDFFARILAGPGLGGADPSRGRFRSYLLGALKHYLADARDRALRDKRGAGREHLPIDAPASDPTSPSLRIEDPGAQPSDAVFDREWALTLMDRALKALQVQWDASGKGRQYERLKPWLVGGSEPLAQAEAARDLGLSEGAAKVAIHRLRKRFRELIRSELAEIVAHPGEVDAELRYLVEVLAR